MGLNEQYDGVATFIQQSNQLPLFYEARSRLIIKETRKAKQTSSGATTAGTALVSTNSSSTYLEPQNSGSGGHDNRSNNGKKWGSNHNNKGKIMVERDGGEAVASPLVAVDSPCSDGLAVAEISGGSTHRRSGPHSGMPRHAHIQPHHGSDLLPLQIVNRVFLDLVHNMRLRLRHHAPTDIEQAMNNMHISVPDESWYMDTGAMSHMTASQGFSDGDPPYEMQ